MVPGGGNSVTFTGGTEAEIRAALATLAMTAPLHTDQNITLTVAATTTDNDGSTATTTQSSRSRTWPFIAAWPPVPETACSPR